MNHKKQEWQDALPDAFKVYCNGRDIDEVECIIPDLAGMSRGKAMPAKKFSPDHVTLLPVSIFYQTISGEDVEMEIVNQWAETDLVLRPDMSTAKAVPWAKEPTLQIIHDLYGRDGVPQSVLDLATGNNLFSNTDGSESEYFRYFIGGSQRYLPEALPLIAPYVNSYRRFIDTESSAPTNFSWGYDNRATGLRVPHTTPENRRLENRVVGVDASPYLAIASLRQTSASVVQPSVDGHGLHGLVRFSALHPLHAERKTGYYKECCRARSVFHPLSPVHGHQSAFQPTSFMIWSAVS